MSSYDQLTPEGVHTHVRLQRHSADELTLWVHNRQHRMGAGEARALAAALASYADEIDPPTSEVSDATPTAEPVEPAEPSEPSHTGTAA